MPDRTLFETLARNRPEWLAQGLFIRAVETEPSVRRHILEKLCLKISADVRPEVHPEVVAGMGWRADVAVCWPGIAPIHFELKLAAPFTPNQRLAGEAGHIQGLVVPVSQDYATLARGACVFEWWELAAHVKEDRSSLKVLLEEVSLSASWLMKELRADSLSTEFTQFASQQSDRHWPSLYLFLSTVNMRLVEKGGDSYRASSQWTCSSNSVAPYYGYRFQMGEEEVTRYWVGFWREEDSPIRFGLTAPSEHPERLLDGALPLHAETAAASILARVKEQVRPAR